MNLCRVGRAERAPPAFLAQLVGLAPLDPPYTLARRALSHPGVSVSRLGDTIPSQHAVAVLDGVDYMSLLCLFVKISQEFPIFGLPLN